MFISCPQIAGLSQHDAEESSKSCDGEMVRLGHLHMHFAAVRLQRRHTRALFETYHYRVPELC